MIFIVVLLPFSENVSCREVNEHASANKVPSNLQPLLAQLLLGPDEVDLPNNENAAGNNAHVQEDEPLEVQLEDENGPRGQPVLLQNACALPVYLCTSSFKELSLFSQGLA